ncbi:hypothetical protein BZG36_00154 [Bifiguratus adelaidae]|uniref:Uncharacterized protein n=1 Tax=Bifiguratus adelaidae TaxID=1938954 RepID=A0A261Y8D8_9FUNG|nr:hypothetical protein BZG36_00154 [Bifiguratus adelaidae]
MAVHTVLSAKAFIFDLDGTLMDTSPMIKKFWYAFAQAEGLDPHHVYASSHGRTTLDILRDHVPHKATPELAKHYEDSVADDVEGITIIAGVLNVLNKTPFGRWGINTSGGYLLAKNRLAHLGVKLPEVFVTYGAVKQGKPAPDSYLLAAEKLGVPPQDCIVFEDAVAGVQAGKAAGMRVVGLLTAVKEQELREAGADVVVKDMTYLDVQEEGDALQLLILKEPVKEVQV